jgi:pimeloyl-ACP methyl ester carboxylesterase
VPDGFTGAWMWGDVAALLERAGIEALAVELPTIGEENAGADFYADAASVRELLDRLAPPVVLCGHSYGGAVITEAVSGPHPAVRELVHLTAAVPDAGDSMVGLMSAAAAQHEGGVEEGVTVRDDGLAFLDREAARRALFNDCTPERAEEGLARLRPMSLAGGDQPVTGAAWRQLPSVYVRGSQDRGCPRPSHRAFSSGQWRLWSSRRATVRTGAAPIWSQGCWQSARAPSLSNSVPSYGWVSWPGGSCGPTIQDSASPDAARPLPLTCARRCPRRGGARYHKARVSRILASEPAR